jgi:hypothetical protein
VTGGRASLVPWGLIAVNLFAACLLALAAGGLARASHRHAMWGVPLALVPGGAVALARDTTELLALAALACALLALRRGRPALATLAMCVAILTRETTLALALGMVLAAGIGWTHRRRIDKRLAVPAAVTIAVFAAWQLLLAQRWGEFPTFSGAGALGPPFVGFARVLAERVTPHSLERLFDLAGMVFTVFLIGAALASVRRSTARDYEKFAFLVTVLVASLLTFVQWQSHLGYFRATVELTLLGGVVLLNAPSRMSSGALSLSGLAWSATAFVNAVFI